MSAKPVLSARQRAAIAHLIGGATQEMAALYTGVTPRTLRRWLEQPVFRAELHRAQDATLSGIYRELAAGATDMLTTLRTVALDGAIPPSVRVRAALGWLAQLWQARELGELTTRVAELERRLPLDGQKGRE